MTKRRLSIVGRALAFGILALAWWLGSPLLFDKEVDEEFPLSAGAETPADLTADEVEAEMERAAGEPDSEVEEEMPAQSGPVALATGGFEGADEAHRGSGTATIYELEDGSRVLRLEDFEATNGPDLHVYLVPDRNPAGRDDVRGYVDLGSLKGNLGDQNYDIPDEVDPEGFGSVVVYCAPFHVIFSTATLG